MQKKLIFFGMNKRNFKKTIDKIPIMWYYRKVLTMQRDVAQFGRVLRSGRRGRRFKSCHPDQIRTPHKCLQFKCLCGFFCFSSPYEPTQTTPKTHKKVVKKLSEKERHISAALYSYSNLPYPTIFSLSPGKSATLTTSPVCGA